MKYILCFLLLCYTAPVFAFGGAGGGHGMNATTYKGGVDAIGVHINGDSAGPIGTDCPVHSAWRMDQLACVCDEGWIMNENECIADPCVSANYDHECQTCTVNGTEADIQNLSGYCGQNGDWVCYEGSCMDMETYQCVAGCDAPNKCLPNGEI